MAITADDILPEMIISFGIFAISCILFAYSNGFVFNVMVISLISLSMILFRDVYFVIKNITILKNIEKSHPQQFNINKFKPSYRHIGQGVVIILCLITTISSGIISVEHISYMNTFRNENMPIHLTIGGMLAVCSLAVNGGLLLFLFGVGIMFLMMVLTPLIYNYSHGNNIFKSINIMKIIMNGTKKNDLKQVCYICTNEISSAEYAICKCGKQFHRQCISSYVSIYKGKCYCDRKFINSQTV